MDPVKAIIQAGFGLKRGRQAGGVMFFRVEIALRDAPAIGLLKSYNKFIGENAAQIVSAILANNAAYRVDFGREYSPVIYVHLKPGQEANVVSALKALKPDELGVSEGVVRAWWD